MYIIGKEEIEAVKRVIESGQLFRYRGGENGESDNFEKEWSEMIGCDYTIAMTSGTAALICGLVGMSIGPGDEVIIPAYTFMATASACLAVGAVPVLANIDESLTIDPEDIERKITPRTKAIIPVHMCGLCCDMSTIMQIADKYKLFVLEDACQADGGSYRGRHLGAIGDAGAFSFNQFKILSCGEGGALVTDNRSIYERALIHHDSGAVFRSYVSNIQTPVFSGWNFRTNEISSAILRVQLTRLNTILGTLHKEKRIIMDELKDQDDFVFNPINDVEGDCATTVALLFPSVKESKKFLNTLKINGIEAHSPIDSGLHVYTNWTPIMEKRGGHHPARDAYKSVGNFITYSPDMCKKTLSILERTVYLLTSVNRSETELLRLISKIKDSLLRKATV
jgi:dTDP-4-amino-4,6-dideoxygalactose transaminase